jgi:outer membrane protein assembly factor BamB
MTIVWDKVRFDLANSAHPPTTGPDGSPTCRWKCNVGYHVPGEPAVVGNRVYVATMFPTNGKSKVFGIDRESGDVRMRPPPDDPFHEIRGSVCVRDGIVYVSTLDDHPITRGYDATTGERVREYDIGGLHGDYSPFVADGVLYSTIDWAIGAFDVESEEELWTHNPGASIYGTPALVDGTLYAGVVGPVGEPFDSGDEDFPRAERQAPRLQAIDVSSGDVRWDHNILAKPETPAVVDGMVYVCGREPYRRFAAFEPSDEVKEAMREERTDGGVPEYGVVQALSVDDGSEEWRLEHPHPVTTPPAVTEERLVVGTDAGSVLGLDTATGAAIWETPVTDGEIVRTAPAIADGVVHVGGGETLYGLDMQSGNEQWTFDLGAAVDCSPAVLDGTVYVSCADNTLRAIE